MLPLSMDIIADELKDIVSDCRIPEDSRMNIEDIRFLNTIAEEPLSESILYVGDHSCLPDAGTMEHLNLLYLGGDAGEDLPNAGSVLKIDAEYDLGTVMNRLLGAFSKYRVWKDTLDQLLKDQAPLDDFLDVSQPILKTGIVLMDWDHNCVAMTRNVQMEDCPLWNAILDGYGYKYSFVIEHSSPKLADINESREMQQNWSNLDHRYLYNMPLLINGYPMYGIGLHKIEEPEKPFGRHTPQLLKVLAEVYTARLTLEAANNMNRNTLYDTFIRDSITGKLENPDELNRRNQLFPYEEGDHLVAGVIAMKNVNYRTSYLNSCAKELETYWPESGCSVVGCELFWLVNLKDVVAIEFLSEKRQKRFRQWLDAKKASCGFSCAFQSLSDLRKSYQQAKTTLHYGLIHDFDNGARVFNYFDHFDWQLVEMASAMTDLSSLIHPAIHTLINFDRQHNTDYYETLREYLLHDSGLTLNEMADKLHIHRNTLRYRLDRICEIAQFDLKNATLKQQALLSIYCFDLFPKMR